MRNNKLLNYIALALSLVSVIWFFSSGSGFWTFIAAAVALVIGLEEVRKSHSGIATSAVVIAVVGIVLTSARFIGCISCAYLINKGLNSL